MIMSGDKVLEVYLAEVQFAGINLTWLIANLQDVELTTLAHIVAPEADWDFLTPALEHEEQEGHFQLCLHPRHRVFVEAFVDSLYENKLFLLEELAYSTHATVAINDVCSLERHSFLQHLFLLSKALLLLILTQRFELYI